MILASALRQVRGLGDNKFEVVTTLRTFVFRAEREGTTSAVLYQLLFLFWSVCLCRSNSLIPCLALFSSLFLSLPPPFLCLLLSSLILASISLNVVIFCVTSFSLFVSLSPHVVVSLPFLPHRAFFRVIRGFIGTHMSRNSSKFLGNLPSFRAWYEKISAELGCLA